MAKKLGNAGGRPAKKRRPGPKTVVETRIEYAMEGLAEGVRHKDLVEAIRAEFGIARSTAEKDIASARRQWGDDAEGGEIRKVRRVENRTRLKLLWEKGLELAESTQDMAALVRVCAELSKLDGLREPVDLNVNHGGGPDAEAAAKVLELTRAQRDVRIAELDAIRAEQEAGEG